jgi:hypothetical protein
MIKYVIILLLISWFPLFYLFYLFFLSNKISMVGKGGLITFLKWGKALHIYEIYINTLELSRGWVDHTWCHHFSGWHPGIKIKPHVIHIQRFLWPNIQRFLWPNFYSIINYFACVGAYLLYCWMSLWLSGQAVSFAFLRLWVQIWISTSCLQLHFFWDLWRSLLELQSYMPWAMRSTGGLSFYWERPSTYGETRGARKVDPLPFNLYCTVVS